MSTAFRQGILAGKTAFIAGGSSGINLGIAHGFAQAGARVAIMSRSQQRIDAAVEELCEAGHEAFGFAADVRDFDAVERTLNSTSQRYGNIDIVVSGAAGNFVAAALGMSANGFKAVIDIDLLGTFNVFRASHAYLRKPGASLISISAGQGAHPMHSQAHVCAAKAGVNMLTQCLALEWGTDGIRVNAISPGPIAGTEGMRRLTPTPELEASCRRAIPLGRYGEREEIAELAVFLASEGARYITGAIIDCDGGAGLSATLTPNS
jgi:NAD(P)-dependent dehydrogenase (short-subunit alcohol dehydrogenase family)